MSSNQILDMQALLAASMDDIDDLPPVGVPPTGHYDLDVSVTLEDNKDKTGQYFKWAYKVDAINQIADEAEAADVAVGTIFIDRVSPFNKAGEPNEFGMGKLKQLCAPFAQHLSAKGIGDVVQQINHLKVSAELKRSPDRKNPEQWRFNLTNVVVK